MYAAPWWLLGCGSPIEVDDEGDDDPGTTTPDRPSTSGYDDDGDRPITTGPYTATDAYTTGVYTTGVTYTSGSWTSPTTYTDGGWDTDDGWPTTTDWWDTDTWGGGECWGFDEFQCAEAASFGLACAWVQQYVLSSRVSCSWEGIGSACVDLEGPEPPECVAPPSCANGVVGTFQVETWSDIVVPYAGCSQIAGYATCIPGSPSPECACACANPL
jgi:hypothetical protein